MYALSTIGSSPLGSLAAGFAADGIGPGLSGTLFGGTGLVVVALAWTLSDVARLD